MEQLLELFGMSKAKPVKTPLAPHLLLSSEQSQSRNSCMLFLMQIFPVISTKGGQLRVMYFGLGMVQLVGCQSFNRLMNVLGVLSTTEAEYMALTEACKEAVWLQSGMREIGIDSKPMDSFCESMSVLWPRTRFLTRGQSILRFNFITSVKSLKKAKCRC